MRNLVSYLIAENVLITKIITKAFLKVDRKDFVLPQYLGEAHEDYPLPIGHGQTISQPTTVAIMLELLQLKRGAKVLDVGSGSGWTTALLADIVGEKGKVIGLEIIPELVEFGQKNLAKYKFPQARIIKAGDKIGHPEEAPYDKILVSAAAEEIPKDLVDQLKKGGTLVIPVRNSVYKIRKISKDKIVKQEFPGFAFVPLV